MMFFFFCSRSWAFYTATWQGECKCFIRTSISNMRFLPCKNLPARNFYARQCSQCKTVKQFLEAKNFEIMKWPVQSGQTQLKILGDKVMTQKPVLWKRLEEEWTKITPEMCDVLRLQMC